MVPPVPVVGALAVVMAVAAPVRQVVRVAAGPAMADRAVTAVMAVVASAGGVAEETG